ncbi:MAG: CDP-alcohol phosphatidyltransferase family protein [Acidobacteriota bacterium]|nr:CDP-alcohol phosphatidyltransferase family protein [Acidobacteriota bacterium]MDQ7088263.1 CDP-alcohol phosphatidyltransferase family protein [Acidobacteriota bacterium]
MPFPDNLLRQLTLANQLTLLRLVAVPVLALALLYGRVGLALGIFIAAGITDRLDGMAARRFGQQTALGAFLDPAADKLLMLVVYVVLAMPDQPRPFPDFFLAHHAPAWLTFLVVTRDVMIVLVSAGMYLHADVASFPPTRLGKWTTGFELVTAGVFLLANVVALVPPWLLTFVAAATGAIVVASGLQYLLLIARRLRAEGEGRGDAG